ILCCYRCRPPLALLAVPTRRSSDLAYEHGEGVPKDQLKAASLYCEAARAGNAEAQYALGWMYTHGRGVPRDDGMALGLFDLAIRSEEHTSELQSRENLVCRLLLEKK